MFVPGHEGSYLEIAEGADERLGSRRSWLHLPLDPERLRKLTEDYVFSNAKIKAALGVERMPVGAREGLRRTLSSFSGK